MQRHTFPDIESLSRSFAQYAETALQNTLSRKPHATLALPGGNTPRHYLPALAKCALPWDRITVTLSDERWVDVDNEQSNERLVKQHLPAHVRFAGLKTRHGNPFAAIGEIHQRLDKLLPLSLTVLGMGKDGHIASLFPGKDYDTSIRLNCIAVNEASVKPSLRISLSLNMLADSENIVLIVPDQDRSRKLDKLLELMNQEHSRTKKEPLVRLLQQSKSLFTIFQVNSEIA